MSRGFVKEDDQEEAPLIPPRASLPPGVTNYVTPRGLELLQEELRSLNDAIHHLNEPNERERRRALAQLNGKRNLLLERIQSARVLTHEQTPPDIRFGAHITYTVDANPAPITIQIVGVDEASVPQQKIAFTAPIAKALIGKKPGEQVPLNLGGSTRQLKVLEVTYS